MNGVDGLTCPAMHRRLLLLTPVCASPLCCAVPVLSCPAAFCENLLEQAGPRFAGPIAIMRNWTYCLFYVMAELWGSVVVSVLFWGFANQVCVCVCVRVCRQTG